MNKHNVFISWSGDRSQGIADALYEWLPMVVQSVKPWMSRHSIDKGSRGALEMAKALDGTKVGITCLTPENLAAPWILYEAGCLSKTIDDQTRLCTYLLGGLQNRDIEPPLAQFQHTSPTETDTRVLVHTINKAVGGDDPVPDKTLDAVFTRSWPMLQEYLDAFPSAPQPVTKRSVEDMLSEILEFTRSETNRRNPQISYLIPTGSNPAFYGTGTALGKAALYGEVVSPGGLKVVGSVFDSLYDPEKAMAEAEQEKTVSDKDEE
jgi:TIR domain